jgi:tetratricopeptide (TPR) repeat protein
MTSDPLKRNWKDNSSLSMEENTEESKRLTSLALDAANAGNLEKAEKLFHEAWVLDNSNVIAAVNLSIVLFKREKHEDAMNCSERAVLVCPMEEASWANWTAVLNNCLRNAPPERRQEMQEQNRNYQGEGFIHERHKIYSVKPDDILIRALEEKYADSLLEKGELFFRETSYFRKLEDSDPRQDEYENKPFELEVKPTARKIMPDGWIKQETNIPGISVKSLPGSKGSPFLDGKMGIGGMESLCCFSIVSRDNIAEFLEKYDDEKLGSHVIVIKNVPEFIERVEAAFDSLEKASVKTGYVTYIHEGAIKGFFQPPHGYVPLNPFIKRRQYSSEFEYRLVTSSLNIPEGEEGAKIHIGSVEDIAEKMDTKQLKEWLKDNY